MPEFTTEINLQGKNVFIKELKVKHFKILLKTLLGDNPDPTNTFNNVFNILKEITTLSIKQLKELSIIDFLILITHIRCISIGSLIQLEVKDEKNTKLSLNLTKVIDTLEQLNKYHYIKSINNIQIEYQIPNTEDFVSIENKDDEILIIKSYIRTLKLNNNSSININKINDKQFYEIFNLLPANYSTQIFKQATEIINFINETNLLNYFQNEKFILRLTPSTIIFILQILFSKNLYPLYENIFALCKFANFSPAYIEECTPGEYIIFTKMLERFIKEQNAANKAQRMPIIKNKAPDFL